MTGNDRDSFRNPGAAQADTDSESGITGEEDTAQALRALEIMRKRGLIAEDEYIRRKAEIEAPADD